MERGRWSKRGVEPEKQFSASYMMAPNNVKMAARDKKDQAEVWNQVANSQQGLAANSVRADRRGAGAGVESHGFSGPSAMASTSIQLALESKPVVEATAAYVESLSKIVDDKNDAVGYAYAINGKVNSAEVYASNDLFRGMWPKLLKSSAAEALTEKEKTSAPPPNSAAVEQALSAAETGHESSKEVKKRVTVAKKESGNMILFETRVKHIGDGWLHRSYVAK